MKTSQLMRLRWLHKFEDEAVYSIEDIDNEMMNDTNPLS